MSLKVAQNTGTELWVVCPFHKDHNPSMVINLAGEYAGRFHCFGCGRSGLIAELGLATLPAATQPKGQFRGQGVKSVGQWWEELQLYQNELGYARCADLARQWGICRTIPPTWGYRWDGEAHCFPMYEGHRVVGIHRRFPNGRKVCYPGSRLGLFRAGVDNKLDSRRYVVVTEGISDACVANAAGFQAVGLPCATACIDQLVKETDGLNLILVPDNDEVGWRAMEKIIRLRAGQTAHTRFAPLPTIYKDLREFYAKVGWEATFRFLKGA